MRRSLSLIAVLLLASTASLGAQGRRANPCSNMANGRRVPVDSAQCAAFRRRLAKEDSIRLGPDGPTIWVTVVNKSSWPVSGSATFYLPPWPGHRDDTVDLDVPGIAPKGSWSVNYTRTSGDSPYVIINSTYATSDVGALTLPASGSARSAQCANNNYVLTLTDGAQIAYEKFSGAVLGPPATKSLACQIMNCPGGGSYMGGNTVVYKEITKYATQAAGTWSCGS
jgi:hypothetical protein